MSTSKRWILVAGTGLVKGTPIEDVNAAPAIGTELARNRYGLVTGGWPGVDYLATQAFLRTNHFRDRPRQCGLSSNWRTHYDNV
jgi:hypothetical protein